MNTTFTPQSARTESSSAVDILLVDDDIDVGNLFAEVLSTEGYRVAVADNLRSAQQILAAQHILCVVADYQMPEGDGLDLVRLVRQRYGDDIVLIALTVHSATDGRIGEFLAEVDHHFLKPVDWDALFKVIGSLR